MSILYAIGGPNGAGKTTFMKSFFDDKIPVLRPDDLGIDPPPTWLTEYLKSYL